MKPRRLYFAYFVCVILFFFGLPMVVYANPDSVSKTVMIELPQDYVQCTFYVSFEKEMVEDTILISPSNKEYDFTVEEDGTLSCTVKNAKQGQWRVVATKNTILEPIGEDTEQDGTGVLNADEEIGKITVSVKSESESASEVSGNIKIAKEIANLAIYFKDDSIVTEWDDDSCGNVDVTVTNSSNLQVIAKNTVKEQYLEVPIPESVEEIILDIIPSASNGVKGAGDQYVLQVDNHPDARVTFEPIIYTNKDSIWASVELGQPYSLLYVNNDTVVGQSEILPAGEHEIEVAAVEGENAVKVYVVDEKGNMRSTSIDFIKDTIPPVLKLENDINGIRTYDERISFSGVVEDFDQLIFRNGGVFVEWDGTFQIDASLAEGDNTIELTAVDVAGNEAVYRAVVTRLVKEPLQIPWTAILSSIAILVILMLLFIKRKKKIKFAAMIKNAARGNSKAKKDANDRKNISVAEYIYYGAIILSLIILFNSLILGVRIQSGSMEPNIKTGEYAVFNRLAYVFRTPQRGDIVVYDSKEQGVLLVKRIIGLPGDTIKFADGYIFINGFLCDETYIGKEVETNCQKEFMVPEDCYFLLGDNRENSLDARYWNDPYAAIGDLKGRIILHTNIIQDVIVAITSM